MVYVNDTLGNCLQIQLFIFNVNKPKWIVVYY